MKNNRFKKVLCMALLHFVVLQSIGIGYAGTVNAALGEVNEVAEFTITNDVLASNIEAIGANLTTITGANNYASNNEAAGSGFEPAVIRELKRCDQVGANWFQYNYNIKGGITSEALNKGVGKGATVRFYRLVKADGGSLTYTAGTTTTGTDATNMSAAAKAVFVGEAKLVPKASNGKKLELDRNLDLVVGDYAFIYNEFTNINEYEGDVLSATAGNVNLKRVLHTGTMPSGFTDGGKSCLEVTATDSNAVVLRSPAKYIGYTGKDYIGEYADQLRGEGKWYSRLKPGAAYKVKVWLRQEGLGGSGKVRFGFTGGSGYNSVNQTTAKAWEVTGEWAEYEYEFTAPKYPDPGTWHIMYALNFTGPGKLYIDNFVIYRNDEAHDFSPFTPHEVSFNEMMDSMPSEGKKPSIRFYPVSFQDSSMEANTTMYGSGSYSYNESSGTGSIGEHTRVTLPQAMAWSYKTGDSPATRVVPYLTFPVDYYEEEWKGLIEYLGVPYDPETDTPESKPYAYRRYVQRGNDGTPWTDEFREILIELGNETWHNGAVAQWDGFGPPGKVWSGGKEYGLFAKYIFNDVISEMPEWKDRELGNTISFILGASYSASVYDYAELGVQQGGDISYVAHANYVGPKWETGDAQKTVFDDAGMQETLIGMLGIKSLFDQSATTKKTLNAKGIDYELMAYEGGPSGYDTSNLANEVNNLYGKSAGMGLAALDAWLYSSSLGYRYQNYLGFSSGNGWSSHTSPEGDDFRGHAGWQALKMRNKYAVGDTMLKVNEITNPSFKINNSPKALTGVYTITDGYTYSVFVLNRKNAGEHNGTDFGDGYTPVTLNLPFDEVMGVKLHKLAHADGSPVSPMENNFDEMNVNIYSQDIDKANFSSTFKIDETTGGDARGIPPGGVYMYVFSVSEKPDEPEPTPPSDTPEVTAEPSDTPEVTAEPVITASPDLTEPPNETNEPGSVVKPKSVKLNKKKITLKVKKSKKLKATLKPKKISSGWKKLTWKSSKKKIAKVNKKGKVTALKVGKTKITVKTRNKKKAKCTVIVKRK